MAVVAEEAVVRVVVGGDRAEAAVAVMAEVVAGRKAEAAVVTGHR